MTFIRALVLSLAFLVPATATVARAGESATEPSGEEKPKKAKKTKKSGKPKKDKEPEAKN